MVTHEICHLSFVICHLSFVICYLSFVICYLLFIKFPLLVWGRHAGEGGTFRWGDDMPVLAGWNAARRACLEKCSATTITTEQLAERTGRSPARHACAGREESPGAVGQGGG